VERAIKAKADDRDARLCKGSILTAAYRTQEALEIYQSLGRRQPDDAHVQSLIDQTLNALNQGDEADLALRQAVALIAGNDENAEHIEAIYAAVNRVSLLPAAYRDEAELVARREEFLRALHHAQDLLQATAVHSKMMKTPLPPPPLVRTAFMSPISRKMMWRRIRYYPIASAACGSSRRTRRERRHASQAPCAFGSLPKSSITITVQAGHCPGSSICRPIISFFLTPFTACMMMFPMVLLSKGHIGGLPLIGAALPRPLPPCAPMIWISSCCPISA